MTVALVHPPLTDPTMPYVAVPLLTAVLRRAGHEVLPIDGNLEAVELLLAPGHQAVLGARARARIEHLQRLPALDHAEQLELGVLHEALSLQGEAASSLGDALDVLRDRSGARFFDEDTYEGAVRALEAAIALVAAAHHPLELDFARYRTPFSWLTPAEVARDASPERDPFRPWVLASLVPRLRAAGIRFVGVSVAFPGQLQPAWSIASALRAELPEAYLVVGGPAVTQRLAPLAAAVQEAALGPFDAAVLFEGEKAILELVEAHLGGTPFRGVWRGEPLGSLADLPPPDFDGLPLDRYLSPELVLPYDASRGCPWNRCAFCHYGLAEQGTAAYRERPIENVARDLLGLAARHGARLMYLSQDSLTPRLGLGLARALAASQSPAASPARLGWASDMRPDRSLTPERARELAAGGCVALSLGVESGSPRLLGLIDKGVTVAEVSKAIHILAGAGIAVEAMAFTDFPTETGPEALATLAFLEAHRRELSLFVCGRFELTAGSRVARDPGRYGVEEIFRVAGDTLGTGLFFRETRASKRPADLEAVEEALDALSGRFRLRPYPWAGSLSTAHTLLHYLHRGPGAFRVDRRGGASQRGAGEGVVGHATGRPAARSSYDPERVVDRARAREEQIWQTLVFERREVSREAYEALARALPVARPRGRSSAQGGERRPRRRGRPRSRR